MKHNYSVDYFYYTINTMYSPNPCLTGLIEFDIQGPKKQGNSVTNSI